MDSTPPSLQMAYLTLKSLEIYWPNKNYLDDMVLNDVSIYEIIHIFWTADIDESDDPRSEFSNLSNWKEEASHRYRGGHGFESRWSPDFFSGFFFPVA